MDWERVAKAMAGGLDLIGVVTERFKQERSQAGMRSAVDALTIIGAIASAIQLPRGPVDPASIEEAIDRLRTALLDEAHDDIHAIKEKLAT